MSAFSTLLLLLLIGTWGAIFWVYRRLSRDLDELARERVDAAEAQANVTQVATQLQQAADELGEALAVRTERLEQLLRAADERLARLAQLPAAPAPQLAPASVRREEHVPSPVTVQPAAAATVPGTTMESALSRSAPSSVPNGTAHGMLGNAAVRPTNAAALAPRAAAGSEAAGAKTLGSYDEVRRLAAEGLDAVTIAQRTNRGREEVRLLLQLGAAARVKDGMHGAEAASPADAMLRRQRSKKTP